MLAPKGNVLCVAGLPETLLPILGEVMPQCPVLHILRAAQDKVLFTGTLQLSPQHPSPPSQTLCAAGPATLIRNWS